MKTVQVVFNINGEVIGVADTFGNALSIYEKLYGDTPNNTDTAIREFRLNELQYS